jgi:hypothetical protein
MAQQGRGDGLTSNLLAVTKSSSMDSGSKSHENVELLGLGGICKEFVEAKAQAPCAPVAQVHRSRGTVHCGMGNFLPRRVEITSELCSDSRRTSCHEFICEKAEREKV